MKTKDSIFLHCRNGKNITNNRKKVSGFSGVKGVVGDYNCNGGFRETHEQHKRTLQPTNRLFIVCKDNDFCNTYVLRVFE